MREEERKRWGRGRKGKEAMRRDSQRDSKRKGRREDKSREKEGEGR